MMMMISGIQQKKKPGHTWDCPLVEWPTPLAATVRLVAEEDATARMSSAISWTEVGCRTAAACKCLMRPQSRETATAGERWSPFSWRSSKILESASSSAEDANCSTPAPCNNARPMRDLSENTHNHRHNNDTKRSSCLHHHHQMKFFLYAPPPPQPQEECPPPPTTTTNQVLVCTTTTTTITLNEVLV